MLSPPFYDYFEKCLKIWILIYPLRMAVISTLLFPPNIPLVEVTQLLIVFHLTFSFFTLRRIHSLSMYYIFLLLFFSPILLPLFPYFGLAHLYEIFLHFTVLYIKILLKCFTATNNVRELMTEHLSPSEMFLNITSW